MSVTFDVSNLVRYKDVIELQKKNIFDILLTFLVLKFDKSKLVTEVH